MSGSAHLRSRVADLETLDREALLALWLKAYGRPPFKGARQATLIRGISYSEQTKLHGSLKTSTKRRLLKIAKELTAQAPSKSDATGKPSPPKLQLGSQMVREWNGKTYTVHATDQGFVLNGVTYGSLSAVAKAITGAHWSGPRFFGVRG